MSEPVVYGQRTGGLLDFSGDWNKQTAIVNSTSPT